MSDHSAIEWTDATWNPLRGCSRVSAGCQHCYAETVANRFSKPGMPYAGLIHPTTKGWNGKVDLADHLLDEPVRWKRPRRIFVNSMSDLFHESVPDRWIDAIFGIMSCAPQHQFQVLTKRPARMLEWFQRREDGNHRQALFHEAVKGVMGYHNPRRPAVNRNFWPLRNVWLSVSVENQATADERIPLLLQCPAAVRWLSCEPLLGPINFRWAPYAHHAAGQTYREYLDANGVVNEYESLRLIDWVVAGGESGTGARPMHPDWARSLRDQCDSARVPFFFKQWGEWASVSEVAGAGEHFNFPNGATVRRVGKKAAGRLLDGVEHNAYPMVQS